MTKKMTIIVSSCDTCPMCLPFKEKKLFGRTAKYCTYQMMIDHMQPVPIQNGEIVQEWCTLKDATDDELKNAIIEDSIIE